MSVKDGFEIAAYAASVGILTIAAAPHLHRAWYLLTTDPRTTDERIEEIRLWASGRMGPIQHTYLRVLWWFRHYSDEELTWRERFNRAAVCPIQENRFGPTDHPGRMYAALCSECHYYAVEHDEEALRRVARSGRVPWSARRTRPRGRDSLQGLNVELDQLKKRIEAALGRQTS